MAKRATKRQRTRQGSRESRPSQRRRSSSRLPLVTGLAVVLIALVIGGIYFVSSGSSDQPLASIAGLDVGGDVGDQVPGFNMRLVNGSTINSTELVSAEKPVFYFFFATW